MEDVKVLIKKLDRQGRFVIPSYWRKKHNLERVKVIIKDDEIIIKPFKSKKISEFFDSVEVDLEAPLTDWEKVKIELLLGEKE